MYLSEEIILTILIGENKQAQTLNRYKRFYKFYGIVTNHFPYKLFLKEQKALGFAIIVILFKFRTFKLWY